MAQVKVLTKDGKLLAYAIGRDSLPNLDEARAIARSWLSKVERGDQPIGELHFERFKSQQLSTLGRKKWHPKSLWERIRGPRAWEAIQAAILDHAGQPANTPIVILRDPNDKDEVPILCVVIVCDVTT